MKTFKTNCGCEIHVIKWSAKANSITVKSCPLHKHAKELLAACKAYLEFAKDVAISPAAPELKPLRDAIREAVARAEGRGIERAGR